MPEPSGKKSGPRISIPETQARRAAVSTAMIHRRLARMAAIVGNNRNMKIRAQAVFAGILAGASVLLAADATVVEQIVAKVNGDIITRSDLDRARKELEMNLRQRGATPAQISQYMADRQKDLLRDRVDELLLVQKSKDLNINVDSEVSKYLAGIQAEQKIPDPEKFQAFIREQTGQSFEDFKAEIRNNMLRQRVIGQEVSSKINVPKSEIEEYYNQHKAEFVRKEKIFLREIFVSTEGKDAAAAEKKAKELVARARKGERFDQLARDNSDNTATAKQGGDLGEATKDQLREDIVKAVWEQPRGYVTEPLKMGNGFLVLKVEDHYKEGQASLAEVENEIREKVFMPRFEPKVREYLTQLRREAFYELRDGYVDSGAAPGKDTRWDNPALLRPETVTKEEVANQKRLRRLLFAFPIPGTQTSVNSKSSSK